MFLSYENTKRIIRGGIRQRNLKVNQFLSYFAAAKWRRNVRPMQKAFDSTEHQTQALTTPVNLVGGIIK